MASIGFVILALALSIVAVRVFQVTDLHPLKRKARYQLRRLGSMLVVALLIGAAILGYIGLHGLGAFQ